MRAHGLGGSDAQFGAQNRNFRGLARQSFFAVLAEQAARHMADIGGGDVERPMIRRARGERHGAQANPA